MKSEEKSAACEKFLSRRSCSAAGSSVMGENRDTTCLHSDLSSSPFGSQMQRGGGLCGGVCV